MEGLADTKAGTSLFSYSPETSKEKHGVHYEVQVSQAGGALTQGCVPRLVQCLLPWRVTGDSQSSAGSGCPGRGACDISASASVDTHAQVQREEGSNGSHLDF